MLKLQNNKKYNEAMKANRKKLKKITILKIVSLKMVLTTSHVRISQH